MCHVCVKARYSKSVGAPKVCYGKTVEQWRSFSLTPTFHDAGADQSHGLASRLLLSNVLRSPCENK